MVAVLAEGIAGHAVRDFMQQNCGFDTGFGNSNPLPRCCGVEGSGSRGQGAHFRRMRQASGSPYVVDYRLRLLERHCPCIFGMDVAVFPCVAC